MNSASGLLNFGTTAMPATGTIQSQPISVINSIGFNVQLFWTGTPTGTWALNGSNDVGQVQPNGAVTNVINWTAVEGSSSAVSGTSGNLTEDYNPADFRWFQVVYTATSGTGTITSATWTKKGS